MDVGAEGRRQRIGALFIMAEAIKHYPGGAMQDETRRIDLTQRWWIPFLAHASTCTACKKVDVDRTSSLAHACYAGAGLLRDALHHTAMDMCREICRR